MNGLVNKSGTTASSIDLSLEVTNTATPFITLLMSGRI